MAMRILKRTCALTATDKGKTRERAGGPLTFEDMKT